MPASWHGRRVRFTSMKLRRLLIFSILFSSQSVAEKVEIELDGNYVYNYPFVYSEIEIRGTEFSYNRSTDELGDPWSEGFPISGKVEISGNLVSLIHSRLKKSERHYRIIIEKGNPYLIADKDYEKWEKNKLNLKKSAHRKVKNET